MRLPYDLDDGPAPRAAIGLILLQTDETLDAELPRLFPEPGVALHAGRIPFDPAVTPETLAAMGAALPAAAALLPSARPLDAVAYGCTSGATVIGPERVAEAIRVSHPAAAVTDPVSAAVAALRALGARRIGVLTPYRADVSAAMRALLEREGFEVAAFGSFEQETDSLVARIADRSVAAALETVGREASVDAVFASCTNLRTLAAIPEAEARLGKPVVSSNLALAWRLRALTGLPPLAEGPGRLLATA